MNHHGSTVSVSKLAQKVIDAYAHDPEGLTREECEALTETPEQADVLCSALGRGAEGDITGMEWASLRDAGFDDEFLKYMLIGNPALRERVKWFADQPADRDKILELIDICTGVGDFRDQASQDLCHLFDRADENTRDCIRNCLRKQLGDLANPPLVIRKLLDVFSGRDYKSSEFKIVALKELFVKQYGDKEVLSFVYDKTGALLGMVPGRVELKKTEDDESLFVSDYNGMFPAAFDMTLPVEELGDRITLLWETLDELPSEMFRRLMGFVFVSGMYFDAGVCKSFDNGQSIIAITSMIRPDLIAHELAHHWDNALAPGKDSLFNRISWHKETRVRHRRGRIAQQPFHRMSRLLRWVKNEYDPYDFINAWAEINPNEDLAHSAGIYFGDAKAFRSFARYAMEEGTFEISAKYLFVKHVMPFGGREYDLDETSPSLTIEEVKEKYLAAKDKTKTNPGTWDIILEIEKSIPKP
ncbi:MAG: hypothetical protein JXA24_01470 [Proteobacteria bacterium]|nr:hypothetical protein [Pseudomonadota bacterium]